MEYPDANNNPIKQGFYVETFYKGKDEFRNRIVYLGPKTSKTSETQDDLFSIMNRANISRLNHNYSRWLRPFDEELASIV